LQKYGINGDKVGGSSFTLDAIPLSVIPAKAGIQIRDDPVDCVSPGFFPCFPVRPPLDPCLRGDDEGRRSVGRFESKERKTIDLLQAYLRIEPFKD
jgi:hypothetical protein